MCEFCKRFDFSTAKTEVDKHGARLLTGICNTKFSEDEQFNFCSVCGRRLKDNVADMKWTSLKEAYPPKDTYVLVYKGDFIGDMMDVFCYEGGDTWKDCYGYSSTTEGEGITHWMPLPEPPQEI